MSALFLFTDNTGCIGCASGSNVSVCVCFVWLGHFVRVRLKNICACYYVYLCVLRFFFVGVCMFALCFDLNVNAFRVSSSSTHYHHGFILVVCIEIHISFVLNSHIHIQRTLFFR